MRKKYLTMFIFILSTCLLLRLFPFVKIRPWDEEVVYKRLFCNPQRKTYPIIVEGVFPFPTDALAYHTLAINLIKYQQFSYEKDGVPNALRTPLYPLFIALHYIIFGERQWIVLLSQIFLSTISCFLLFIAISKALNVVVGLWSALFFAIDPVLIYVSNRFMSETLFVFFLVGGLYFFSNVIIKKFNDNSIVDVFFSALFFGLATLTRPVSQYLIVVIPLVLFVFMRRELKKFLRVASIFVLAFLIPLLPWLVRNYITFKHFSLSNVNNMLGYIVPMETERRGKNRQIVFRELIQETDSLMIKDGVVPDKVISVYEPDGFKRVKYSQKLVISYITKHPFSYLKSFLERGFLCYFNSKFVFILIISYICSMVGLVVGWKSYNKMYLSLCLVIVLYFILIQGPVQEVRFRLPNVPFYLCFAGIGMVYIVSKINDKFKNLVVL